LRSVAALSMHVALLCSVLGVARAASRAEFVAQLGHTNAIDALAFSPDGRLLASGGHDSIVKLWDVRTGSEFRALAGHGNTVTSLAFSRDGKTLVSASLDASIRFWDVESGKSIRVVQRPAGVNCIAVSPDGRVLASCGMEPEVHLWNFATGENIKVLRGHTRVVNSASFSSDGRFLATGGNDNTIRFWELPSGREVRSISLPALHVLPPDAKTGKPMETHQAYNTDCVTSVVFSPNNSMVASVSYSVKHYAVNGIAFAIALWDVGGRQVRVIDTFMGGGPASFIFMPDHNSVAGTVSFSPDGKTLLATGFDYSIKQWDVNTGLLVKPIPVITWDEPPEKAHETLVKFQSMRWDPPRLPTFSPDRKTAAFVLENSILIWDVAAPRQISYLGALTTSVSSVSLSPDGHTLATANGFRPTRLWDLLTGGSPRILDRGVFPPGASSVAFSPKGDLLASAALDIYQTTGSVDLWDSGTGRKLRTLTGTSSDPVGVAFDSTGAKLAVGRLDDAVSLFDVASGTKIRTFDSTTLSDNHVALSEDGRILAHVASGKISVRIPHTEVSPTENPAFQALLKDESSSHVTVWNSQTGAVLMSEKGNEESFWSVALSRDGKLLAVAGTKTFLWNVATHRLIRRFDAVTGAVAFSPDGTMLAGGDGADIRLWDLVTGAEIALLRGHQGRITSLSFGKNGRLASGAQDGSARLWDVAKKEEIAALFSVGDSDYAIATPENYYMTSRSGLRGVAFRLGVRTFPFDQFDLRYNRPDKVLERLGASKNLIQPLRALAEDRARRLGFDSEKLGDDFHVPELKIVDPGPPLSFERPVVHFTVRASDTVYELNRLNVFVNGVPIHGAAGVGLTNLHTKAVEREITVPLTSSQNKIQVSVVNEKAVESLAETIDVTYTGTAVDPKLYLLSIGVSGYMLPENNLRYPAGDARAVEQFWHSGAGRFKSAITRIIQDRDATRERIRAAKSFLQQAGIDDVVVLFFAGHGVLDKDGNYYFGTWDFNPGTPADRGLPYAEIENLLDGLSARKKLVLIDTCHAGSDDQQEILRERFADLRRGTGAHVVAASGGLHQAQELNEFGSGAFTFALLEGLRGKADVNSDGEVNVAELRNYVSQRVQELSHGQQRPSVRAENLDLDFSLARRR
jgi:WD40 repeat protein